MQTCIRSPLRVGSDGLADRRKDGVGGTSARPSSWWEERLGSFERFEDGAAGSLPTLARPDEGVDGISSSRQLAQALLELLESSLGHGANSSALWNGSALKPKKLTNLLEIEA